jgi:lysophospholipase L1-like esterase
MGEQTEPRILRRSLLWAAGLGITLAAGCGGHSTQPDPPPPPAGPTLTCPASIVAPAHKGVLPNVTFDTPTAQGGQAPVPVICDPASGSEFPLGDTTVTCTATDALGRTASCAFTVTVNSVPALSKTRYMAFGDSMTAGTTSPAPTVLVLNVEDSYPTKLLAMLSSKYLDQTITVINEGMAGQKAEDDFPRFQDAMRADHPQVVLLLEGANDINTFGEPSIPKVVGALEQMVRDARSRGALVLLATLPPQNPDGKNGHHADLLPELNKQIADTAADEGATLVDLYRKMSVADIGADGLHPTAQGYDHMAQIWQDAIEAQFQVDKAQTDVPVPSSLLTRIRR